MDITHFDVSSLIETKARSYSQDYESKELINQVSYKLGIAEAVIWKLLLELPQDKREEIIKDIS